MRNKRCIIVGASHAGATLALQLRKEGWEGSIQLIGAEPELPYHRPPLSKDFLAGNKTLDEIRLRPAKLYQDNAIDLLLGTAVAQIDTANKLVTLGDQSELGFDKLALCTGSIARKLPIGESLHNVFTLRSVADVLPLVQQVKDGKRAVIIGAGYIGLETAAVLAQRGVQVTVLEMADRVLQRVTSETMSDFMAELHRSHGVNIQTSVAVTEILGQESVEKVVCADGSEYAADFLIVGIGVSPNTSLAEAAGLEVKVGVLVNQYTQTSMPDIYAAGDCTCHPSLIYDRLLRLESVQNANEQARIAAANICGKQVPYDSIPWFWSDQFDIKLQMVGINEGYDEVVSRGDTSNSDGNGFALFYLKHGVVIAADCVGRPREFMIGKQLVKRRLRVDPSVLSNDAVAPADFVSE